MPVHEEGPIGSAAQLLGLHPGFISAVLYKDGVEGYYRVFNISKKAGGTREIAAPSGHLLRIQQKIATYLQDQYRPRASVHGFVRGRSIVTNAQPHVGKDFVLNIDLEDFFPTIHFGRVLGMLEALGFERGEAVAVAKLCCYQDRLPIGGPASPVLANMICSQMDGKLQELASQRGAFYTRYADDMTFSWNETGRHEPIAAFSKDEGPVLDAHLSQIVESNSFAINEAKTRLMFRTQTQRVTGLLVNEKVNVSRSTIRKLRAMIHSIERDGLEAAQRRFETSDTRDRYFVGRDIRDHLWGWMAYLTMVRGERDAVTARLERQLKNVLAGQRRNLGVRPSRDERMRHLDADIEDIELSLRWVIAVRLDNDPDVLPQHLRKKIGDRVQAATSRGGSRGSSYYERLEGMLEFADLRDLEQILVHKTLWHLFDPLFGSKQSVATRFGQLAELRNSIRHSRSIDEITRKDGEAAILWFRRCLSTGTLQSP